MVPMAGLGVPIINTKRIADSIRKNPTRKNVSTFPSPEWFWMTALAALYSTARTAAAIIIAIFEFRDL